MTWFKSIGNWIAAAALAFLAVMAARQVGGHKKQARRWQEKATEIEVSGRDEDLDKAKAALTQAKLADARAEEARKKAQQRLDKLGDQDENVADIVDRWRKPGRMHDNTIE